MSCSRGILHRPHPLHIGVHQFLPAKCKRLRCPECGPRKAALYRKRVFVVSQQHGLRRMVSLTLDQSLVPAGTDSVEYINQVFHRWQVTLKREYGLNLRYVRVLEFQLNGYAHFHLLVNLTIAQDTLIKTWVKAGGGHQCRIRYRDGTRGASYITKYITKNLALNVPEGRRMITTSRGIVLLEKTLPTGWVFFLWSPEFVLAYMETSIIQSTSDLDGSGYFESYRAPPWEGVPCT